ncbi:thioredoxin [uncultured Mediterranean phage uvMED]|nr:thioredoxin [uncultured Mediterranean phage uvMED]
MRNMINMWLLVLGLSTSSLYSQSVSLDSFQDVQLLNVQNCSVVQVNASWNYQNRVRIEQLDKLCYIAEIDIEDKTIGATIVKEWGIEVVPTIIVLKEGKEVKRFVPGISMRFDERTIIEDIRKEVR